MVQLEQLAERKELLQREPEQREPSERNSERKVPSLNLVVLDSTRSSERLQPLEPHKGSSLERLLVLELPEEPLVEWARRERLPRVLEQLDSRLERWEERKEPLVVQLEQLEERLEPLELQGMSNL